MKTNFIIQYANYIITKYEKGNITLLQNVTKTVRRFELGYITVSETMKELSDIERELELAT